MNNEQSLIPSPSSVLSVKPPLKKAEMIELMAKAAFDDQMKAHETWKKKLGEIQRDIAKAMVRYIKKSPKSLMEVYDIFLPPTGEYKNWVHPDTGEGVSVFKGKFVLVPDEDNPDYVEMEELHEVLNKHLCLPDAKKPSLELLQQTFRHRLIVHKEKESNDRLSVLAEDPEVMKIFSELSKKVLSLPTKQERRGSVVV